MNAIPVLGALANETALVQRLLARDERALRHLYERFSASSTLILTIHQMKRPPKSSLLPVGLLVCSAAQLAGHYTAMPDFATGSLTGIGIGLLLLSFVQAKPTPEC